MAFTRPWTASYEGTPQNSEDARLGAQRIREAKVDIRERFDVEHAVGSEGGARHKFPLVTLAGRNAISSEMVNGAVVFRTDCNAIQVKDSGHSSGWRTYYGAIVGEVRMFSGHVNDIPKGWKLADGATYNGYATPNLKSKFIVGTNPSGGGDYDTLDPVANPKTGGSDTVVLTVDNLPDMSGILDDPGHKHDLERQLGGIDGGPNPGYIQTTTPAETSVETTGITFDQPTHSQPVENRPAYYALALIIYVGLAVGD